MELKLGALPGHYDNGMSFADVLAINHYGSETIPPRPVLREAAERCLSSPAFKKRMDAYKKNVIEYAKRGRIADVQRATVSLLNDMGRLSVAEAKRIIENVEILQRNAPSTVAKKGFNKPLYVNGDLEKHLGYEISED